MRYDYLKLSVGSLKKRKLRSWLTMIGIFIGIASVISLIGLGEGLRIAITSQFGFLGSDILSVQAGGIGFLGPPGTGVVNPLSDELEGKISKIPGVEAAFNRYLQSGTMEFNDRQAIGAAISLPSGENRKIMEKMMNIKAIDGRLLKDGDDKKLMLGYGFSEDDIFGKGIKAGDRVLLSGIPFEVVGIMEKKGSFLFDGSVLVNEDVMLDILRPDDGTVEVIGVKVKDVSVIDKVKEDVEKLLRNERDVKKGEEDFEVSSPAQIIETLNSTLFAVQLFVYIIAFISLAVGGIGIMNTMYTSVIERTKEIGIMKAIGAKNSTIFTLFFIESGMIGMIGGVIGIIIGATIAYGLAVIGRTFLGSELIQANVSPSLVIGALLFAFLLGTTFGVLPAIQASKMQPIEAVRTVK
jgi:putative ABC transport system permease protein